MPKLEWFSTSQGFSLRSMPYSVPVPVTADIWNYIPPVPDAESLTEYPERRTDIRVTFSAVTGVPMLQVFYVPWKQRNSLVVLIGGLRISKELLDGLDTRTQEAH